MQHTEAAEMANREEDVELQELAIEEQKHLQIQVQPYTSCAVQEHRIACYQVQRSCLYGLA